MKTSGKLSKLCSGETSRLPRAFFGEVDPVHHKKCDLAKKGADSTQVETALANLTNISS
jgi:hypothetical protein